MAKQVTKKSSATTTRRSRAKPPAARNAAKARVPVKTSEVVARKSKKPKKVRPAARAKAKTARGAKAPLPARRARSRKAATPSSAPARSVARVPARPVAAVEAKPATRRAIKHAAPAIAPVAKPAPNEPLFPIAPPSGQRDVDLATAIQKSRMFFAGHGLGALAGAIPSAGEFGPAANPAIEEAHSIGLDDVFVFPPVALQRDSLDHLVHRMATTNSDRLSGDQQYGQPWLYQPETLKSFEVHGRPGGAYALCFYSGPFPASTGGKNAGELRDWLDRRQCASLTVYEYLVLQRLRAEQHGDHRFDLNSKDAGAQWHWLLDMKLGDGNDAKYPMAGWNSKMRRIELGWCGPRDPSAGKGTPATRVIPASVAASANISLPDAAHA
jgi:hypothetical protein